MAQQTGKCPGCDSKGVVGQPCDERACAKRGHHFIPDEYWDAAHQRPDAQIDPTIGQVVGDFLVVGFLGSGGFGKVFLALQQPLLRLKGALKLLEFPSDNVMLTEALLEKFQGEAEALADVSHPNIVRLLKYGTHGERPYLVMEFVDQGATLRDEIWHRARKRHNFTHFEIQHILRQILNGLEAAHAKAIIHRDIKPENIMLQKVVGNPHHVRILDFGTAKFVENRADTKWPLGSPSYMAPEQVGLKGIGPWSDLYAVGVVCFEMLTGRRPFVGETDNEIVAKKLDPEFDPLERISDMVLPAAVEAFFRKALERDPADRFRDVKSFRAALYKAFEALAEEGRGALAEEGLELSDLVDSSDVIFAPDEEMHELETRRPAEVPPPHPGESEASTRAQVGDPVKKTGARALWGVVAVVAIIGAVGVVMDPFAPPAEVVPPPEPDAGLAVVEVDAGPPVDASVTSEPTELVLAIETSSSRVSGAWTVAIDELASMPTAPAITVGAGKFHSCVMLRDEKGVRCWGNNGEGEIGAGNKERIGDDEPASKAPLLTFGDGVVQVSVSGDRDASFACARTAAGEVYCWGSNHAGQLGAGSTENIGDDEKAVKAAVAVPLGAPAEEIGVGAAKYGSHACARLEDGRVRCWGANNFGQLGYGHKRAIGDDEAVNTVGYVPLGGPAKRIWVGKFHNCAQLEQGVRCWGWNDHGQLGDGKKENVGDNEVPASSKLIDFDKPIDEMALGRRHSCALTKDGEVYCWGWNSAGQLGLGNKNDVTSPELGGPVKLGGKATAIVAGGLHTCALLESGKVRCWGDNKFGQLGYGHTRDIGDDELPMTAGDIYLGRPATGLAAGSYHTCAVVEDSGVRCWGYNMHGQLGYGHGRNIGDDETPASAGDVPITP